jgi:hypothetical protein
VKKILVALTAVVAIVGVAVPVALAAQPASVPTMGNKLTCFDGPSEGNVYGGKCTVNKYGVATLDNSGNDPQGEYSGVYLQNSNLVGKTIGTVNQLGFSYTGIPTAGSPRISLGIDKDGNGQVDEWAYLSAFYCNDGAGNADFINDPTCTIYTSGTDVYANWAAMVEAHPDYRVGYTPFVIADDAGKWTVFNVKLGKGSAGGLKK